MRTWIFRMAGVFMLLAGSGAVAVAAAPGTVLVDYPNPDPANPGDWFGGSVAAVGNNALIGACGSDVQATDAGAAYLFTRSGTLLHSWYGAAAGDMFGYSVAARGNDVLVGAMAQDGGTGHAYIYDGSTYLEKFSIVDPTPNPSESFGSCVAPMGNDILVAAVWDNPGDAEMCGAVYLYDGTDGSLLHTFQPPVIKSRQHFGTSVTAVGNNRVLIGAQGDDTQGFDTGAAYLYSFDGSDWNDAEPLTLYAPIAEAYFGRSVAALGDDLLVSSYSRTYLFDGATGELMNTFPLNGVVTTVDGDVLISPTDNSGPQLYRGVAPYDFLLPSPGTGYRACEFGDAILVGDPVYMDGIGRAYLAQGIPEPSTLLLLTIGSCGLLTFRRRHVPAPAN